MLLTPCYFFPFFCKSLVFLFLHRKTFVYFFFSYQKQIFQKHVFSQIFHTIFISDSCFQHLVTFCNSFDFLLHRKTFAYLSHYRNIYFSLKFFTPFLFHTHISISYSSKVTTFHSPLFKIKILTYFIKLIFLFSYWIILLHIVIKFFFFQITHHTLQEIQLIFIHRIVQKHFHPQLSLSLYSLQFEHLTRSIFF